MKLIFRIILITAFLSVATLSFADNSSFNSFSSKMDSWVNAMEGKVVSVNKKRVEINFGKKAGVFNGAVIKISREGEELTNPLTGESLGRKHLFIGTLTVNKVTDKTATGFFKAEKGKTLKKGDKASVTNPLPIKIVFKNLDIKTIAEAKYAILKSGVLTEDNNSSYLAYCSLDLKTSTAKCSFDFNKTKIVAVEIPLVLSVVHTAGASVKIIEGTMLTHKFDYPLEKSMSSIAMGKVMDKNGPVNIVLSDGNKIYVYNLNDNNTLTQSGIIEGDFDDIVNIETADLNGNGKDEIFVSNIKGKGKIASSIYEYDGTKFVQIKKNINLLFRSFFTDGTKKIICQSFADADFAGMVYTYAYINKNYEEYEAFDKSYGANLYGFAYGKFGIKNRNYTVNFDSSGRLTSTSVQGDKFVFGKKFGFTPHRMIYFKTIMQGMEKDSQGALINIADKRYYGFPVYQRIIELEPGPSKFFMIVNNTKLRKDGEYDYLTSYSSIQMFIKNESLAITKLPEEKKAALDADIIYTPKDKYIAVLSQKGKNGKEFSSASSDIEILSINR